uniref:extensin-like n=1 Tax=Erigeron canadensis TaxID=72917 RepID=UPI001CB9B05B|nr:extensin-like [Erigeron canadensis]
MKDLAEQLNDVDHLVSESRLVLQMVTGLSQEYDTVASFIIQADTSWDDAREMIEREQRRQAARQAALIAHNPQPCNPTNPPLNPPPPQTYHPAQTYDTRNPTRGRGRGRNSYRGPGRGRYSQSPQYYLNSFPAQHPAQQNPSPYGPNSYPSNTWWASPPPYPHPAQSPWQPNWFRPTTPAPPQKPTQPPTPPPGFGLTAPPPQYPSQTGYPPKPNCGSDAAN